MKTRKTTKLILPLSFGHVLREVRVFKGFSQVGLAEAAHLDRTYVSLLERSIRHPSLETVFALAGPLGISPSELVKLVEDRELFERQAGVVLTLNSEMNN